ncbi:MAG TPA: 2Fe-2S iron-sulfur cluster binding domain-containing protein [Gammaproteobacteria bacterium]|nr:2Fe-2S iron-sulfur cluster binding domain-containing protein [Gammaproteobacteria bacterium]
MSYRVTNHRTGTQFTVNKDESILDAALRLGILFPYGCRSGVCGSCKTMLTAGSIRYAEKDERPAALSEQEHATGMVMLCQAIPCSDLTLDAAEIGAAAASLKIHTLPSRVAGMTRLTDDVMRIRLQLPKEKIFDFLPGQYLDVLLDNGRRRSFSIANAPSDDNQLELHIRHVEGGDFTEHVFKQLKIKDILRIQGPLGTFFMRQDSSRPVLMLAGGTGLAPAKAILEQQLQHNTRSSIHLFWGVRNKADLYADTMLRSWCDKLKNFQYTPVLSEAVDGTWDGASGWVHEALLRHYPDLTEFDLYASGPPPMIAAARGTFAARGLSNDRFFYDSFEFNATVTAGTKEST